MPSTLANGKICYLEMPATDSALSAGFYRQVFGWNVRTRGDGRTAFDDTTGEVSGAWVPARPPAAEPGSCSMSEWTAWPKLWTGSWPNGGTIVQPIGADAPEITARFSDPAGYVIGLYQQPS